MLLSGVIKCCQIMSFFLVDGCRFYLIGWNCYRVNGLIQRLFIGVVISCLQILVISCLGYVGRILMIFILIILQKVLKIVLEIISKLGMVIFIQILLIFMICWFVVVRCLFLKQLRCERMMKSFMIGFGKILCIEGN